MPLAEAQAAFAQAGQMLAIDPPLGAGDAATIGGVMATTDSGPLRHRYGGMRDLIVGITVVLSDGTVAQSGGKVIKNVAGYDLAKLFTGSFGTLGLIAQVSVRLHPAPAAHRHAQRAQPTTPPRSPRPRAHLAALPLEADCLDVTWDADGGRLLVRFGGATAPERARAATRHARSGRRRSRRTTTSCGHSSARASAADLVVKVSGRPTDLEQVIAAAGDAHRGLARRARRLLRVRRGRGGAARRARAPRRARCSTAPTASRTRGRPSIPARWQSWSASRRASTRPASSGRALSWEDCEHGDPCLGRHPPARAGPDHATACTAASACRRAPATRCSRTRWTRRAGGSC